MRISINAIRKSEIAVYQTVKSELARPECYGRSGSVCFVIGAGPGAVLARTVNLPAARPQSKGRKARRLAEADCQTQGQPRLKEIDLKTKHPGTNRS
jgi:hypothetical protein